MCSETSVSFSSVLMTSDKLEIIGVFNIVLTDTLAFNLFESAIDKLIATKESPPKSKNESSILISVHFKRLLSSSIIILSMLFLGGTILFKWFVVGSGKAFLSTFPLIFNGNLSKIVMCAGIM